MIEILCAWDLVLQVSLCWVKPDHAKWAVHSSLSLSLSVSPILNLSSLSLSSKVHYTEVPQRELTDWTDSSDSAVYLHMLHVNAVLAFVSVKDLWEYDKTTQKCYFTQHNAGWFWLPVWEECHNLHVSSAKKTMTITSFRCSRCSAFSAHFAAG